MSDVNEMEKSNEDANAAIMAAIGKVAPDFTIQQIVAGMSSTAAVTLGRFFGPGDLDEAEVFGVIAEFSKAYENTAKLAYQSAITELAAMTAEERKSALG